MCRSLSTGLNCNSSRSFSTVQLTPSTRLRENPKIKVGIPYLLGIKTPIFLGHCHALMQRCLLIMQRCLLIMQRCLLIMQRCLLIIQRCLLIMQRCLDNAVMYRISHRQLNALLGVACQHFVQGQLHDTDISTK